MNKTGIIVGSSRNDGNTMQLANEINKNFKSKIIDLNEYSISYYDYLHQNKNDDFIPLIRFIIENYDTIIFITPVYWYAMSGIMKVFFDRITDLITIEKDLGRKLRGKKMAVISTSNGENLGDDFWLPFDKSADYLGMEFIDGIHTIDGKSNIQINNLIELLLKEK